ncbi:MAG: PD-(D/E)XK nuclease family protein [Bacteroidales bacterium]|nr:PD-(D/E)XK nuclease family protein [Bacteroidales bacterium]
MQPFLKQIAQVYLEKEGPDLVDLCFVFPNKRSAQFFNHYLSELAPQTMLQPSTVTITDFMLSLVDDDPGSRIEQLFILYNLYREILDQKPDMEPLEFDRFQHWGDVLLSDFSDVDRYLVDADQLFCNIKNLREIASNFLTQEQIDVIREYWDTGDNLQVVDEFWRHVISPSDNNPHEQEQAFLKLWEVLAPLYHRFHQYLEEHNLTYDGKMYRDALERLKNLDSHEIAHRRFIFVGFNALSTSEVKIMERLAILGMADFYWDLPSPAFDNPANHSTRFLKKLVTKFPSLYDLPEPKVDDFPEIDVVGVPSTMGMAKLAGERLAALVTDPTIPDEEKGLRTAIVLPEEDMFIPLLHSIPDTVEDINITMGFSLRFTPIASLIQNIVSLHLRARKMANGVINFYYEDLITVLSHPLMRSLKGVPAAEIVTYIHENHLYNIPAQELAERYRLPELLSPIADLDDAEQVFQYILNLLYWLQEKLSKPEANPVESAFIKRYINSVEELHTLTLRHNITIAQQNTVFRLLERLVASEKIPFEGTPLKGVQVMGMLETRCLDFDHLFILSMNENSFPRKHFSPSFIPNSLRAGYGMATMEFQEAITAYNFYRLIARPKHVTLIYSTMSDHMRSAEVSRYVSQLRHVYHPASLHFHNLSYRLYSPKVSPISIEKTPEIMAKINRYRATEGDRKYFSPSAISKYLQCPLDWYLSYIEDYMPDDELVGYMDEGTYGTIIHDVAENIYQLMDDPQHQRQSHFTKEEQKRPFRPVVVTPDKIDRALKNPSLIERLVTQAINDIYRRRPEHLCSQPLEGEDFLLGQMMVEVVQKLLRHDRDLKDLRLIDAEHKIEGHYEIVPGLSINMRGYIDRIDIATLDEVEYLRIVDYKTGSDNRNAKWSQLFDNTEDRPQKAPMQLMAYALAYGQDIANTPLSKYPIRPTLYKTSDLSKGSNESNDPIGIGNEEKTSSKAAYRPVLDFRQVQDTFREKLGEKLAELFDPAIPFTQCPDLGEYKSGCKYCKFTALCRRST